MVVFYGVFGLACVTLLCQCSESVNVTVRTNIGNLVGYTDDVQFDGETRNISKFLGIPYAEPPVGFYRFRSAKPKAYSDKDVLVQTFANSCYEQFSFSTTTTPLSEDCLYLNVFAPIRDGAEVMPVMVFIYGGGFTQGSSHNYVPDFLTAFGHVIVVTFNYRMSVWGFLSTEDSSAPGNYGLWDQRLAIKWVSDNIRAFGGDKSRITIFGESAGAASVIYQGLYPGNRGLFRRIIAQSGSASSYWALKTNPKSVTEEFAKRVGCYNETANIIVECLRNLTASTIDSAINDITNVQEFLPSTDNIFVTCRPGDILKDTVDSWNYQVSRETLASFDLMMGINSGEGVEEMQTWNGYGDLDTFLPNKTYFDEVMVPILLKKVYGDKLDPGKILPARNAVSEKYSSKDDTLNPLRIREQFILMYGDASYLAPMHATIQSHFKLSSRNAYMYYLNVNPSFHLLPTPSWFQGANHADDIIYLFKTIPLNDQDTQLAKQIVYMWSNFANTGNPSQPQHEGVTRSNTRSHIITTWI